MALTAVADTRLLLTLEFPPDHETKRRVEAMMTRELAGRLIVPTIVLTEFLKIAGVRIGEATARLRLRLLKDRGLHTLAVSEEMALSAGSLLVKHQEIPIADALIASPVKLGEADYVVTDDPHYKTLGIKTKWL
ncbi:MAG TPA: PIN domain-containing protein [Candidatus Bathyarchaeia archaeon]|nr:PIN domain-containing protein [Candidatus Bathyarchaeia archaeon]